MSTVKKYVNLRCIKMLKDGLKILNLTPVKNVTCCKDYWYAIFCCKFNKIKNCRINHMTLPKMEDREILVRKFTYRTLLQYLKRKTS